MFLMRLFEAELSKATCFPKHNKNPRQVTAEGFELHQVGQGAGFQPLRRDSGDGECCFRNSGFQIVTLNFQVGKTLAL